MFVTFKTEKRQIITFTSGYCSVNKGEETKHLVYNRTENSDYEHETGVKSWYFKRKKKVN